MVNLQKINPLILKPNKINNITHAIALLKMKQEKYKDYKGEYIKSNKIIYTEKTEKFNYDGVMQGFLEQKVIEKFYTQKKILLKEMDGYINNMLKIKREEVEMTSFNVHLGKNTEKYLFKNPTAKTFEDEFLFDIYIYLNKNYEPHAFLSYLFEKYVLSFMQLNTAVDVKNVNVKELVREFAILKYNKIDYNIAIYEDRYLWAEVYLLLRLGRIEELKEVLKEFSTFFDGMNDDFGINFTKYLDNKQFEMRMVNSFGEDKFKVYLNNLFYKKVICDDCLISTVEDYLFTLVVCGKKINAEDFQNEKVKILVNLFNKNFKNAAKNVLTGNFSLVAKFFILFQLCGISSYNHFNEDSTTFSMRSQENSARTEIKEATYASTNIFINFFFAVLQKFQNINSKIRFIEIIQTNDEYKELIPIYLIKYELFDIIKNPCLDKNIFTKTILQLKNKNRKKLLEVSDLLDIETYSSVMEDLLEQAILADEELPVDLKSINTDLDRNLRELIYFYEFSQKPTIERLNKLPLFIIGKEISSYKFIIESLFRKIVAVIKEQGDYVKAKQLFKICGQLELNAECIDIASRELVELI